MPPLTIGEPIYQPARFFDFNDPEALMGERYKYISFETVDEILNAKTDEEFFNLAKKYSPVSEPGEEDPEFPDNIAMRDGIDAYLAYGVERDKNNAKMMQDLQRLFEKAISWRHLCLEDELTTDMLEEAGIYLIKHNVSDEQRLKLARSQEILRHIALETNDAETTEQKQMFINTNPEDFASLSAGELITANTPYCRHVIRGLQRIQDARIPSFVDIEMPPPYVDFNDCIMFDIADGLFSTDNNGLHLAVEAALDSLFEINMYDIVTQTKAGIPRQVSQSIYSSMWYELARSFEGGRAMKCEACGKPMLVFSERGNQRKYCSDACNKWAQRHPGEKRSTYKNPSQPRPR